MGGIRLGGFSGGGILEALVPSTFGGEFLEEHFANFSCMPGNWGLESHRLVQYK